MSHPYGGPGGPEGSSGSYGGGSAPEPDASPRPRPTYGQSAPSYGQSAPSYGQSAPSYGQSAPSASHDGWGQSAPYEQQPTSGQGPASGQGAPYGATPPRRRGLKRIIAGAICLVLGGIGMVIGAILGTVIGAVVTLSDISEDDVTVIQSGDTTTLHSGAYFIGTSDPSATCQVTSDHAEDVSYDAQRNDGVRYSKNGTTYTNVGQITVLADAQATVSCSGGDGTVALVPFGVGSTLTGLALGLGIPALLGLLGLVLLISGIVARVRSGRELLVLS